MSRSGQVVPFCPGFYSADYEWPIKYGEIIFYLRCTLSSSVVERKY